MKYTDTKQMRLDFWKAFHSEMQNHPEVPITRKPEAQYWIVKKIGRSGTHLSVVLLSEEEIGVRLVLEDKENADAYFRELEMKKGEIEAALGFSPDWQDRPGESRCVIGFYKQGCPLDDRERWPEYREWMAKHLEDFDRVFRPLVKQLNPKKVLGRTH